METPILSKHVPRPLDGCFAQPTNSAHEMGKRLTRALLAMFQIAKASLRMHISGACETGCGI